MARQQRDHGIFKDFYVIQSIFVFRSSVNSIGTEGTVYKKELKSVNKKGSAIRSIIDADMARQQRVHGIFKDFYVIQNRFSCSAHQ